MSLRQIGDLAGQFSRPVTSRLFSVDPDTAFLNAVLIEETFEQRALSCAVRSQYAHDSRRLIGKRQIFENRPVFAVLKRDILYF